ncbi:MAG: peptide chain release factor 2 [Candidatus Pelagibacterales bacterium]|nr:MAG: peptide chain release factor 2 [Pelagibacterales bacterium]
MFDKNKIKDKIKNFDEKILEKNFWDNQLAAQKILKEKNFFSNIFKNYIFTINELENFEQLLELAISEDDTAVIKDCEKKITLLLNQIKKTEVSCFLSNENDHLDTYLEIHAGAGGTESQDWAQMLRRMYSKWVEKKKCKFEIISEHRGDEAGIKSTILKITGPYMYGWLKSESGVHRLVRISPFDSGARRHTSFASVWIYPVVDDSIKIEIKEKDIRVDTYRSSGAGGQHVNTTDSAVRITHLPTNIVVQCQNERSQHKNKETCFNMLKARLYRHEIEKKEEESENLAKSKTEIGWGHQIRSYVLQPYQLVKDLRNNLENTDPESVLDGEIDSFLEAALYETKSI